MACNSLPRFLVASALCIVELSSLGLPASAAVRDRILAPAARTSYVAIPNSVHPRAKLATDLGPAPGDTRLQGMSIRFNMTDGQQAALDQLLADQQDPSSPRYHQWLTPAQYGAQFGLSSADLATVKEWLTAQGFTVTGVANGGTFITFDGTVAQAQTAFATSIHNLSVDAESHFANVTNVSVPGAFSGVVAAITGLHDFRLKPRVHSSIVKPEFTSSVSGSHFIAPGDLYTIYGVNPLVTSGITGAGETIAVVGEVDINLADVTAFRSASGLSTTNLPTTVHNGPDPGAPKTCTNCVPSQGDLTESSIDVEWSGAMAPAASILFVNAANVLPGAVGLDAMTYAIDNNLAPIVTSSYGLCEAGWGSTDLNTTNALFKQGNAQGQTILSASADQGATDCDAQTTISASQGLNVDFPGSSPYVTSVGGTMFNGDAAATGSGTTWAATQYWTGTSGSDVISSARGYIPEAAWNDISLGIFGGGGGGVSAFFTKPTWQVGTGVPADASRDVPDISLTASPNHDGLLFCVNVALGVSCGDGYRVSATNTGLDAEGGTSFDSQIFGGLLALVEQKIGSRIGNANPTIYALANNSAYYTPGQTILNNPNVVFNDVTTGSNAMLCTTGTPNCGNGGVAGFNAGTGYDLATGWGSVNVANLASAWNLVTPLGIGTLGPGISVTTLAATPGSVVAGATVTLTATVTGSAGTPTGTVKFLANNVVLGTAVPLPSSGIATYSWVTSCSALGQQVMSASYSGDANYQGSIGPILTALGGALTANGSTITSPVEVVVTSTTCADFAISTTTPTVNVAAGGTIPAVTITATPSNNFATGTGSVVFSSVAISSTGFSPTITFSPASVTISSSAAATTSMTMSGITAELRPPGTPGQVDSGTMLARHGAGKAPWYAAGSGVTIASLLLLTLPRRRRLGGLLLLALAIALVGGASGCGSSQAVVSTTTGNTNPDAGTYIVTVIATYTGSSGQVTQHSTQVTYNIN
jgi:Pro-kumamolisin, activation domain/Bacterial Ig-like domain (group 3)